MDMSGNKKIFIAGHNGMVGSSILRNLDKNNIIITKSRDELDLSSQQQVRDFLQETQPDQIYIAAAKVGGIYANDKYPAEFIYSNLMIACNIIHEAYNAGVKNILNIGSSCIYPKESKQPIKESYLLTGELEPTNEPYAVAKIAAIKMCESYNRQYGDQGFDFRSLMPTNLYGYGDNYHEKNSHVIPGLIRRFNTAKKLDQKSINVWGTGKPKREFLFVDDLAKAAILVMNLEKSSYQSITSERCSHINAGCGEDISIELLANMIAKVTGYEGKIIFDSSKPDGTPLKLMSSDKLMSIGWRPEVNLYEGLKITFDDYLKYMDTK